VNPIRVFLAEDHETVRHGIRLLIESQEDMAVVGEASNGQMAASRVPETKPDVLLLDISMPEMNGLETTRVLHQLLPDLGIVALTRYSDEAYLQEMIRAGASGYVLKQSATEELLKAIRAVAAHGRYLDAALEARAADSYLRRRGTPAQTPHATDRETEVLRRMALGYSNKEIATALDISVKTVEVHKANAMRKLGLRGRIDIVRYAVLQGWLQDA
jgi:DNA-binding NarL/FixJ family response regulator